VFVPHDNFPEFPEQVTLQGFCEEIRQHLFGWAILYINVFNVDSILDEEISDINMS
jgi:hypothetical protein